MNLTKTMMLVGAVGALAFSATAAQADIVTYNDTPADTWNNYGSGNDYNPANTIVLTTDAGDQTYLRFHQTFQVAPASTGDVYHFANGLPHLSFDWGIDSSGTGSFDGVSAMLRISQVGGGSFSYDPLLTPDNRPALNGSIQNSARVEWFLPFDNTDASYKLKLTVRGLDGGTKVLSGRADIGTGAVPEPATWALMILGFGGAGAALRRRRRALAAAV